LVKLQTISPCLSRTVANNVITLTLTDIVGGGLFLTMRRSIGTQQKDGDGEGQVSLPDQPPGHRELPAS
jgi:hypothetical protein